MQVKYQQSLYWCTEPLLIENLFNKVPLLMRIDKVNKNVLKSWFLNVS